MQTKQIEQTEIATISVRPKLGDRYRQGDVIMEVITTSHPAVDAITGESRLLAVAGGEVEQGSGASHVFEGDVRVCDTTWSAGEGHGLSKVVVIGNDGARLVHRDARGLGHTHNTIEFAGQCTLVTWKQREMTATGVVVVTKD